MSGRRLDRDAILDAGMALLAEDGPEGVTMRRLGAHLGVDATAMYRHFADKDELLRAMGDRILDGVLDDLPGPRARWDTVVTAICRRLRAALLGHPDVATLLRSGPPRHDHELRLTEALLTQLKRAGLDRRSAAHAYHALIELTVGSAALDADLSRRSAPEREAAYRAWRATYAGLDPTEFPASVAAAPHLYDGSADDRFEEALRLLLAGVSRRSRS
jgi:AcrR family transcriptional regulator